MKYSVFAFSCFVAYTAACFLAQPGIAQELAPPGQLTSGKVALQGLLTPIETLRLATRDAGILQEVLVSEGDQVKVGDVIAVLDQAMFAAELNAAKNEMRIAEEESKNDVDLEYSKISLAVNEKVYQRSQKAAKQFAKAISKTELERLSLESERSRLSQVQALREKTIKGINEDLKKDKIEIASLRLKNRTIHSKIGGTVVEVFHRPGEFVSNGEPIARILNLSRMRVVCSGGRSLNQSEIPKEVVFKTEIAGETRSFPAKITFVSPEIDPVRQTYPIWAEVQNVDNVLKSGVVGRIEFEKE